MVYSRPNDSMHLNYDHISLSRKRIIIKPRTHLVAVLTKIYRPIGIESSITDQTLHTCRSPLLIALALKQFSMLLNHFSMTLQN